MPKTRTASRCTACGHTEPRWMGQCPGCAAWGTMAEEAAVATPARVGSNGGRRTAVAQRPSRPALPIGEVPLSAEQRRSTGITELDRVLGGGFVPGSVTLLGGEPGAGKSTILLQAAHALASQGLTVLYVSAEESAAQVRLRAQRLDALADDLLLASEADLPIVLGLVEAHGPDVLVVDSVQTISDPEVSGSPGGVTQVRECAAALTRTAKALGMATVLVGHVTKDGQLAGPRVLEHLVDTVAEVEGDRHHALRLVRAVKNRFGPVGEVGCFEMTGTGMRAVEDAGRLFVGEAAEGTTGVAVTLAMEGHRPLACELQALAAKSQLANPRRVASGLDSARLALLVAVLEKRAGVDLGGFDVYVSSVGGLRLSEPAVDLALCLAIASSAGDVAVPRRLVALGEVGLAGEVRLVAQTERRLAEAGRLGFDRALLPHAYDGDAFGLEIIPVRDLPQALRTVLEG